MANLATLLAMNLVQNNSNIHLYRASWRWTAKNGERYGFNQFLKLEIGKALHIATIDNFGVEHTNPYFISVADILAKDWYVVGMESIVIPPEQSVQFPFWQRYERLLNRNILIKLPQWDDVYISIRGETEGCLGKVSIRGGGVNDWNPTASELFDETYIETTYCSPININTEMKESYLAYAMSVITARALPDVRDGFKPVHRRVIYAMHALGNYHDKAYKKSARVVGDVIGKYHPHGDCLRGNTLMYGLDGNNYTIKDLTDGNVDYLDVLAYDPVTNDFKAAKAHSFRIGQHTDKVYNLVLSDNSVVSCTANHPFYVKNSGWTKAEDIVPGSMLVGGSINTNLDYRTIVNEDTEHRPVYTLVKDIPSADHIRHHANHDRHDDRPDNLHVCTRAEHAIIHKDFLAGLVKGHETMKSNPAWMNAIRTKNSELMKAYNKALPIIKAVNHIQFLIDNSYPVNEDNYVLFSKESSVYNVTKLDTLAINYDICWDDLITLHQNGGYRLDTSAAFGHTEALREIRELKTGSTLAMRRGAMLAKVMEVVEIMFRDNIVLNWTGYSLARDKYIRENGLKIAIHGRNAPSRDRLIGEFGADSLDGIVAIATNQGHGIYVKSVVVEEVDQEPMYDFTVDDLENALIVTNETDGRFTVLAAHNSAVYESIVRMAQDFSLRYPLVDGQGNFGSIDGDSAAAMRYTEVRLDKITSNMLSDLDFDVVDMVDNYDGTEQLPDALPSRFPNLVVNGSSGIAVGMATNIPPHNLSEVVNATVALIQNPLLPDEMLLGMIPAPDFPTGGIIKGLAGARKAMLTGKGSIKVTSKYHTENTRTGATQLVFTEIPYGGNKAKIITNIAQLVNEKKLEGISQIADESDREGMRIVVTCKRDAIPEIVLSNLLNLGISVGLETSFHVNNMAIVDGMPKLLTMRQMLCHFIGFRAEVVTRRTLHQIQKAKERAHTLEGLTVALANVDQVIELIRTSTDVASAKQTLLNQVFNGEAVKELIGDLNVSLNVIPGYGLLADGSYKLTEYQVNEIVGMRLSKLTTLESDQIKTDYTVLLNQILYLYTIINDHTVLNRVMIEELVATVPKKDVRKTMIDATEPVKAQKEDLIPDDDCVVTMSRQGWIKTQPLKEYQSQHRGGRGKSATTLREDDYIRLMLATTMHKTIMLFTTHGKVYWLNVYDLPAGSRASRGKPVQNFIQLSPGEEVTTILPVREYASNEYLFMATRYGVVKRTELSLFSNQRTAGLIAIALDDGDALIGCGITDGKSNVMLFTSNSKAIHFDEGTVRPMGRQARGVRGIKLTENAIVKSLVIVPPGGDLLCVCANGFGKRTKASEYALTNRSTQGVIAIKASDRNGPLIGAVALDTSHEVMICSTDGIVIRMSSNNISMTGRNTQGVKLIALEPGAQVSAVESIEFIDTGLNTGSGA